MIKTKFQILGVTKMAVCVEEGNIERLNRILRLGPVYTAAVSHYLSSGGGPNDAFDFVLSQSEHEIGIFTTMATIYGNHLPTVVIRAITDSAQFRTRFCGFLSQIEAENVSSELVKNLKFLLDAQISGENVAFLIQAGMKIENAASDPRYLNSISALLDVGIDPITIIKLMKAKEGHLIPIFYLKRRFVSIEAVESFVQVFSGRISNFRIE